MKESKSITWSQVDQFLLENNMLLTRKTFAEERSIL